MTDERTMHTPTPWIASDAPEYQGYVGHDIGQWTIVADNYVIAAMVADLHELKMAEAANAAFIVRAANAHDGLVKALEWAIAEIDRNTCQHDDTKRGGAIWTICAGCGQKWADDEGGFIPYVEKPELTKARAALKAAQP